MKHTYVIQKDDLLFRPIVESDIENMRQWRNKDSIRKSFIYQETISKEQQEQWYKNYILNDKDIMFIIEYLGKAIGTVALYNIDLEKKEAEFGRLMIGDLEARGANIGRRTTCEICKFGFEVLGLDHIMLEVFSDNIYARTPYQKVGFNEVGKRQEGDREIIIMRLDKGVIS